MPAFGPPKMLPSGLFTEIGRPRGLRLMIGALLGTGVPLSTNGPPPRGLFTAAGAPRGFRSTIGLFCCGVPPRVGAGTLFAGDVVGAGV